MRRRFFKSNNHRRLALKRANRKIHLRRQFFYNREFFNQDDFLPTSRTVKR